MHPAVLTRRIIGADELLFLLLWSSGYIGSKIGLPLSGTFMLLFFRYVIAVLLVGAYVSLRSELHWPVFGEALSLLGFVGLFITAGGFPLIHRGEQALAHQNGYTL